MLLVGGCLEAPSLSQGDAFSTSHCSRVSKGCVAASVMNDTCMCLLTAGLLSQLHTLDLSDVFSTSQQSDRQKEGMLTDIIEGTCGHLKKLYVDNAHVGEEACPGHCPEVHPARGAVHARLCRVDRSGTEIHCARMQAAAESAHWRRAIQVNVLTPSTAAYSSVAKMRISPDMILCRELWEHSCIFS